MCFFFFKQKTAYEMRISDWSSDVCSSDLAAPEGAGRARFLRNDHPARRGGARRGQIELVLHRCRHAPARARCERRDRALFYAARIACFSYTETEAAQIGRAHV